MSATLLVPAATLASVSSEHCACCGALNAEVALGERSWTCPTCGTDLDRDGNAADNLRRLGLATVDDGPVPDTL